jgi:hypothetical protein
MLSVGLQGEGARELLTDVDRGMSPVELIAVNHSLTKSEVERFLDQGRTVAAIKDLLESVLLPAFESAESRIRKADSPEFWEAFAIERRLHAFLTCSYLFEDVAREYLNQEHIESVRERLYAVLGRMVLWNELTSSRHITNMLHPLTSDQRLAFFNRMVEPYTDAGNQLLNMERIPQIQAEISRGGITDHSSVLMIGCGPLPLSGIAYATVCEQVVIVDRVAEAFVAAEPVISLLPRFVQDRISMLVADARTFTDLPDTTHMLIAGLTEGKDHLLELAGQSAERYTVLLRTPPSNLLELYYYPLKQRRIEGFVHRDTVAIGVEGYNNTLILDSIRQ